MQKERDPSSLHTESSLVGRNSYLLPLVPLSLLETVIILCLEGKGGGGGGGGLKKPSH